MMMRGRLALINTFSDLSSEEKLEGELNLARRAGVARGEARVGDDAEGRAAGLRDAAGLPEVGVVEDVEELRAELHAHVLGEVRVLDDREVHVVEARADDDVAAETPVVEDRTAARNRHGQREGRARGARAARPRVAHGVREPLIRAADYLDCADLVGPERRQPRQGVRVGGGRPRYRDGVAREKVDGVAALRLDYRRQLPALEELVAVEGQLVEAAEDETVARVEVGKPPVAAQVEAVLH